MNFSNELDLFDLAFASLCTMMLCDAQCYKCFITNSAMKDLIFVDLPFIAMVWGVLAQDDSRNLEMKAQIETRSLQITQTQSTSGY